MQALRLASFMNTPTLLAIQTLIMIGPYLTNSGRFLDAWTLFGTTIRMAHSIGLHRDPKFLDPAPPLRESTIRRTLWWWMLHMDQQYSVTLGRPLGISGVGDCPPPEPLTTNPTILRLGEFIDHFTIHARQILSTDGLMNVGKIDEFTDKLLGLWDTMPEALQFNESWLRDQTPLPDWPLEVMSASKSSYSFSAVVSNICRSALCQGTVIPSPAQPTASRTNARNTRRSFTTKLDGTSSSTAPANGNADDIWTQRATSSPSTTARKAAGHQLIHLSSPRLPVLSSAKPGGLDLMDDGPTSVQRMHDLDPRCLGDRARTKPMACGASIRRVSGAAAQRCAQARRARGTTYIGRHSDAGQSKTRTRPRSFHVSTANAFPKLSDTTPC